MFHILTSLTPLITLAPVIFAILILNLVMVKKLIVVMKGLLGLPILLKQHKKKLNVVLMKKKSVALVVDATPKMAKILQTYL